MERQSLRFLILIVVCVLFGAHGQANDRGTDMDLLKKSIESTQGPQKPERMDAGSAKNILKHFTAREDRWKKFLEKIREGDKGAIVTAFYIIEFSSGETQKDLQFALQETMIAVPDVVLEANIKTNTTQNFICGKPAYDNYELATYLNNDRLEALESMLAAMASKNAEIRKIYDANLKGAAESCLQKLRNVVKIK